MFRIYLLLLTFSNIQSNLGNTQIEASSKTAFLDGNDKTTEDPAVNKFNNLNSDINLFKEHGYYFLPHTYPHGDNDDIDDNDNLYAEYDYDAKVSNYYDNALTPTTKADSGPPEHYLPFDEDVPLQANKDHLPIFLQEPENSFVIKNKPATLRCRAAKALEIFFKCNGIKYPALNYEFVDPHTGVRIIEGEHNVTREHVEEYFGKDKFRCSCYAWTGRGQIRSQSAYIEFAYIKKQFINAPRAQSVEQHSTTILRCEPPPAAPQPKVYWLKNGAPVTHSNNLRNNEDGDLIISQTTLQDMANYSCVAENIAGKRISEPALVTVYVNGGWSSWAPWTDCNCQGRPSIGKRRTRLCSDPKPLNGGQTCLGTAIQQTQDCTNCDIELYVDLQDEYKEATKSLSGTWSQWSEWSRCDSDCLQTRRRKCISREVCLGKNYQVMHCSLCQTTSSYWPIILGLSIAITIFLVMVTLGIKYIKMKIAEESPYTKSRIDLPPELFPSNTPKKTLPRQPDLTIYSEADNKSGFPISPTKSSSGTTNKLRNEHFYEVPQLNNSYINPVDYGKRTCASVSNNRCTGRTRLQSESDESESSCFESSESSYDQDSKDISPSLKNNISTDSELAKIQDREDTYVSKIISSNGDWLQLEKCGVAIYFPEGSVDSKLFWLKVLKEDWAGPLLPEGVTHLSPVIKCGPQHIHVKKPVIIQFPHCAMLNNSNWVISLLKLKENSTQWTEVLILGEAVKNHSTFLQVDSDKVYLMSDNLGDFMLVGKSFSGFDIKLLKIAIFASDPNVVQVTNYELRVYIFEDTLCALYYCLENEKMLGGRLIDNPKTMYCQDGCSDLCVSLEDIGIGWAAKPGTTYQEIPFSRVWSTNLNSLHCNFSLEQTDSINSLEFKIVAFQKKCPSNRQVFYIKPQEVMQNSAYISKTLSRSSLNKNIYYNILENPVDNFRFGNMNYNDINKRFSDNSYAVNVDYASTKISISDKIMLCNLLDIPSPKGNDWRLLAEKLGINDYLYYFSMKISPTENLLNLWTCRNRGTSGLIELAAIFRQMERNDCTNIIERYLGPSWL